MDLLSLKERHARTLLIHYRWDVEKVLAVLVERGRKNLCAEAGLTLERKDEDEHSSSLPTAEMTCQICFEDVPAEKTTVMDCNHRFCNDCEHLPSFPKPLYLYECLRFFYLLSPLNRYTIDTTLFFKLCFGVHSPNV